MFRVNFIPLEELPDGRLAIALAEPGQLPMIDEIACFWAGGASTGGNTVEISDILKKTEQSQRVLDEAGETFTLDVITGGRKWRRNDLDREADPGKRYQPNHSPGGYNDLHRPAAASQ